MSLFCDQLQLSRGCEEHCERVMDHLANSSLTSRELPPGGIKQTPTGPPVLLVQKNSPCLSRKALLIVSVTQLKAEFVSIHSSSKGEKSFPAEKPEARRSLGASLCNGKYEMNTNLQLLVEGRDRKKGKS